MMDHIELDSARKVDVCFPQALPGPLDEAFVGHNEHASAQKGNSVFLARNGPFDKD